MNRTKKALAIAVLAGAACGVVPAVGASVLTLNFSNSGAFSGTTPNPPADPSTIYATATFDDHGGTGSVDLTMAVLNPLIDGAYVNDWYFNLNPALNAALLGIAFSSGTQATANPTAVEQGNNCCKADGTGGLFDFAFHFSTSNPGQLGQGNNSVYTLALAGITANSFNFVSVPDGTGQNAGGGYFGAVHVQGYANSVWVHSGPPVRPDIPVPEPATALLIGVGLVGLAVARRRGSSL